MNSKLLITDPESGEMSTVDGSYDENTRKIVIEKNDLGEIKSIAAQIDVMVNRLNKSEYEKEIKTNSKITYQGQKEINTDEVKVVVEKPQYTVRQESSNTNSRINTGDEIEYRIIVENTGKLEITQMKATTYIPENFFIDEILYMQYGKTTKTHSKTKGETIQQTLNIPVGGSIELVMKFIVKEVKEDTQVVTYTSIGGDTVETKITDMITQTIEQDEKYANNDNNNNNNNNGNNNSNDNNNNNSGNTEKTYKVSGIAWIDKNEDGKKDDGEQYLEGINVKLIDTATGNTVLDSSTSNPIQATTDKDGKYLLTNIKAGKYMVVFGYDANTYTTTNYQKENVSEIYNSNAIEKEIKVDGENGVAGVTDIINVDSTKTNINIGLVNKSKFDLKLEKYVTNITVQNEKGVKSYKFDNSTLAKIELPSSQMAKSTIIIEYKISITNEGNVAGYAKSIIDYKPVETVFNSSLNNNWYAGNDGNLYSTELENTLINPGETKEVKLILTKQMTDANSTIINNIAEIKDSYNEQGIEDKDSAAGNKAQGEDDMGNADTIITVKTGGPAFYTLISIIILTILSAGIYVIKTRILKSKEVYK